MKITKTDFQKRIPIYVLEIAEKLQAKNYKAYLVGGSIRDLLIGKTPEDFDIATDAYPEEIQEIFPKSIAVGAKFGTIVVLIQDEKGENFDVEVTTFRSDADYVSGRWPSKVTFTKTIEEDLSRRDFTINSIALDLQNFDTNLPITELFIDPYKGLIDLENKIIKAVRDPIERFSEDGLRSVRACRLASQLEFEIEEKTFEAIKQTLHITKLISVERFRDELLKLIKKSPKPSVGLKLMQKAGILDLFIPELLEGINVNQPQFHVEDVFEHSLRAMDLAEDSVKLAALFHDIGKPRTRSEDEKGVHFYGHDQVGADMTKEIMKRLRFPNYEIDRVETLVRLHMFYYPSGDWRKEFLGAANLAPEDSNFENVDLTADKAFGWSDGAVRRLIRKAGSEEMVRDLMKLRIADASANPKSPFNPKEIDALSERVSAVLSKEMALRVTDLDITGNDLITNFKLQGKEIGDMLSYLLDKVIEDPLLNKKLDLLRLAKEKISS